MQDPRAFTSNNHFANRTAEAVALAWPGHFPEPTSDLDLAGLFAFLTKINFRLAEEDRRLILAIDEYPDIDRHIYAHGLTEDLLATIRESIQTHRRIIWIFAGSQDIAQLIHAPWTSYLVSARTVVLPMFTLAETYSLLTEPLQYSPLWQKDDPERPRFTPQLWGEGGIERIHAEAGGWPHLVQLLAETVINLLNKGLYANADKSLLERAFDEAADFGRNVLRELFVIESRLPGELDYLLGFRQLDAQAPPDDEAIQRSLQRRLMIVEEDGIWRLRVPLMQRWVRMRNLVGL